VRQHGVVSARQLAGLGLSGDAIATRARAGRLHRLHRGVYAVGHTALTPRSRELAAVLACGPGAVLSHRSAAALWGLLPSGTWIEVTAPRSRKARSGFVVHTSRRLDKEERRAVDAIPVTSMGRTLVDLADVLDERRLAKAVHEAEVRRLLDLRAIERSLARLPGRTGRHRLLRVLADYEPQPFTRSDGERRFLAFCREQGLPKPTVNGTAEGFEVDFFWPEAALVVEMDGGTTHHTRWAFHEDRRRDRALAVAGIQVLRVTPPDLGRGAGRLGAELRAVLARRR
jgi:putative AbiEi antitoxin of type IV toxin-antitoxin system/uncharacterized protein DUF559